MQSPELLYFSNLKYIPVLSFAVLVQHVSPAENYAQSSELLYFRYLKYIPVLSFAVLIQHSLSSHKLDSFKSWIVTMAIVPYQLLSTLVISTVRRCPDLSTVGKFSHCERLCACEYQTNSTRRNFGLITCKSSLKTTHSQEAA
jgi:hypothetical protein